MDLRWKYMMLMRWILRRPNEAQNKGKMRLAQGWTGWTGWIGWTGRKCASRIFYLCNIFFFSYSSSF
jgi:hypothetical protein